ncbi:MAG: sel1 repeat family protein [Gammaproteobacteria bacterium]|nr:sel1 repeat family protein [Gammaproteobacteria bacterium]
MYRDDVVIQDYREAIRWFKILAEQDHAYAHYNLGLMYQKGQGAPGIICMPICGST